MGLAKARNLDDQKTSNFSHKSWKSSDHLGFGVLPSRTKVLNYGFCVVCGLSIFCGHAVRVRVWVSLIIVCVCVCMCVCVCCACVVAVLLRAVYFRFRFACRNITHWPRPVPECSTATQLPTRGDNGRSPTPPPLPGWYHTCTHKCAQYQELCTGTYTVHTTRAVHVRSHESTLRPSRQPQCVVNAF